MRIMDARFIVRDANGHALAYVLPEDFTMLKTVPIVDRASSLRPIMRSPSAEAKVTLRSPWSSTSTVGWTQRH
jgi:hypothetical protein